MIPSVNGDCTSMPSLRKFIAWVPTWILRPEGVSTSIVSDPLLRDSPPTPTACKKKEGKEIFSKMYYCWNCMITALNFMFSSKYWEIAYRWEYKFGGILSSISGFHLVSTNVQDDGVYLICKSNKDWNSSKNVLWNGLWSDLQNNPNNSKCPLVRTSSY